MGKSNFKMLIFYPEVYQKVRSHFMTDYRDILKDEEDMRKKRKSGGQNL